MCGIICAEPERVCTELPQFSFTLIPANMNFLSYCKLFYLILKLFVFQLSCPFVDADNFHPQGNIMKMRQGTPLTDEVHVR